MKYLSSLRNGVCASLAISCFLGQCVLLATGCRHGGPDSTVQGASQHARSGGRRGTNLLASGGFEDGSKGPTGWKRVVRGPSVDRSATQLVWDTGAHAGRRGLKVRHTDRKDVVKFAGWSTTLTGLTPNTWYEMVGRVRLAGVEAGVVYLALGKSLSLPESGTADWKRVRAVTKTGPNQTSLTAQVQCRRFFGTTWFDDVSVRRLGAPALQ